MPKVDARSPRWNVAESNPTLRGLKDAVMSDSAGELDLVAESNPTLRGLKALA